MRPLVEVEELPTQVLAPRSKARMPVTGALAVGAMVVLLAAGFGLLGGRSTGMPNASNSPSNVAVLSSPAPSVLGIEPMPRVTPWTDCSTPPGEPPGAFLEVDGHQTLGLVELVYIDPATTFDPDASVIGEDEPRDAAEVPMDAITDIWIDGGACAVAWHIRLLANDVLGRVRDLESVTNLDRDPAVSAQNRFQIGVAPSAGDHVLLALLAFEPYVVQFRWSIHVPALEAPAATLTSTSSEIPTVMGCDAVQRLANDVEMSLNTCDLDLPGDPARRVDIAPGEMLEFAIDGWPAGDTVVQCGLLIERRFIPYQPPCNLDLDPLFAGVRFPAPEEAGQWGIAIATCSVRPRVTGNGFDQLCGTWYANVLVRD